MDASPTDQDQKLVTAARAAQGRFDLTEPDRSAGAVAAALRTRSGSVYTGICSDVACGIGFCAEHAAIADMLKHRETRIEPVVAVKASEVLPPCGRCRELMIQVDRKNRETRVLLPGDRVARIRELLPERPLDGPGDGESQGSKPSTDAALPPPKPAAS